MMVMTGILAIVFLRVIVVIKFESNEILCRKLYFFITYLIFLLNKTTVILWQKIINGMKYCHA